MCEFQRYYCCDWNGQQLQSSRAINQQSRHISCNGTLSSSCIIISHDDGEFSIRLYWTLTLYSEAGRTFNDYEHCLEHLVVLFSLLLYHSYDVWLRKYSLTYLLVLAWLTVDFCLALLDRRYSTTVAAIRSLSMLLFLVRFIFARTLTCMCTPASVIITVISLCFPSILTIFTTFETTYYSPATATGSLFLCHYWLWPFYTWN